MPEAGSLADEARRGGGGEPLTRREFAFGGAAAGRGDLHGVLGEREAFGGGLGAEALGELHGDGRAVGGFDELGLDADGDRLLAAFEFEVDGAAGGDLVTAGFAAVVEPSRALVLHAEDVPAVVVLGRCEGGREGEAGEEEEEPAGEWWGAGDGHGEMVRAGWMGEGKEEGARPVQAAPLGGGGQGCVQYQLIVESGVVKPISAPVVDQPPPRKRS
jgi:hypothetical protein